jgi:hypothetical protein
MLHQEELYWIHHLFYKIQMKIQTEYFFLLFTVNLFSIISSENIRNVESCI